MEVGTRVRVKEPFTQAFPDEYVISVRNDDIEGGPIYFLEGVESAFDAKYLEIL